MSSRPTTIRYYALAWLAVASVLAYLSRNAIGVAESSIRRDLQLSLEQSGWFMGTFFWSYAICQVPSGEISKRLGTRTALAVFAMVWSLATLGIGLASGFGMLIAAQLLMGASQAGIYPASGESVSHWIPITRRALAWGILAAGMQIGAISASGITGALIGPLGWRSVFLMLALPGTVWAVWFFLSFRDRPEQDVRTNESELRLIRGNNRPAGDPAGDPAGATQPTTWGGIAYNPSVWFLCGQQICRAAGYMFFASWFPTFLQETRGLSIEASGYLQSAVLCGALIGSLLGGTLADWILRRTGSLRLSRSGVGTFGMCGCGILVLGAWLVEDVTFVIGLLALGSLIGSFAGPPTFSSVIEIGGSKVPQLLGLVNMCGNLAAAACPILVGILFERTANWNLVLALFAGIYLAGAICWTRVGAHAVPAAKPATVP